MAEIFADIDAAFTEEDHARSPIVIKLEGRPWEFPGVMPASAIVRLSRWEADGRAKRSVDGLQPGDLTPGEQYALVADLIPDEIIKHWSDLGIDILGPKVERLIEVLLAEYARRMAESTPEGKDEREESNTPSTDPSSSASTGPSSPPTFNESTVSPFQRT